MIRLERVALSYDGVLPVLEDVSLDLGPGVTLVLGPNGSGKSTLLRLAAGVQRPDRGRVRVDGLDLWRAEAEARRRLAYVPDHPDLTPYASVREIVRLVCRVRGEPNGVGTERIRRLGLESVARRSARELSAGQRRRVLLAAARIGTPLHLLLDEPLEDLDLAARRDVLAWLAEARERGRAIALATHDLEPFVPLADRVVALRAGATPATVELPADRAARGRILECAAAGEGGPNPV